MGISEKNPSMDVKHWVPRSSTQQGNSFVLQFIEQQTIKSVSAWLAGKKTRCGGNHKSVATHSSYHKKTGSGRARALALAPALNLAPPLRRKRVTASGQALK